jgi:serine/threonine-protein kinase
LSEQSKTGDRAEARQAAQRSLLGTHIGPYEITRLIGKGGMGAVFQAVHTVIGRQVAIKTIHADLAARKGFVERFFNEARVVNAIGHENIVDIYDVGQTPGGLVYCVMELLIGESLARRRKREKRLSVEAAVAVVTQIAGAAGAAHAKGIVHRDLKPDNVYLIQQKGRADFVKVLDFGIAKLITPHSVKKTNPGQLLGTPLYMSPEQCRGSSTVDHRTDIYSLGAILYELCTGRPPFASRRTGDLMIRHATELPRAPSRRCPDLPGWVDRVVLKALEKDRERRYPSMAALMEDLASEAASIEPPDVSPDDADPDQASVTPAPSAEVVMAAASGPPSLTPSPDAGPGTRMRSPRRGLPPRPAAPLPDEPPVFAVALSDDGAGVAASDSLPADSLAAGPAARAETAATPVLTQATEPAMPAGQGLPPMDSLASSGSGATIAVLPIANLGEATDHHWADGLTEDLIDLLSVTPGLRVRSRGAVVGIDPATADPREVGKKLDVQHVIEGSLRKVGNSMRVSLRLISVADGFQFWAQRFDCPVGEMLAVDNEVARGIAEALQLRTSALNRRALDPQALDLYLKARQLHNLFTQESATQALELFASAYERAPDDPTVVAAYAMARVRASVFNSSDQASLVVAGDLAQRAIAAAPDRAEARLAMASVLFQRAKGVATVLELRRALAAAPLLADAHELLGRILIEAGRPADGIRRLHTAMSLEARMRWPRWEIARAQLLQGDPLMANQLLEEHARSTDREIYWTFPARLALWRKNVELGRADLARAGDGLAALPRYLYMTLVDGQPREEDAETLRQIAVDPNGRTRRRTFFHQVLAEVAAYRGDLAGSLAALREAAALGLADVLWIDGCPILDPIRGQAGFIELRQQVADAARLIIDAAFAV